MVLRNPSYYVGRRERMIPSDGADKPVPFLSKPCHCPPPPKALSPTMLTSSAPARYREISHHVRSGHKEGPRRSASAKTPVTWSRLRSATRTSEEKERRVKRSSQRTMCPNTGYNVLAVGSSFALFPFTVPGFDAQSCKGARNLAIPSQQHRPGRRDQQ
jgi:hypothetical protein